MDRLDAMRLLVTAVETGSLSAAGRKLGVPLPTVSRNIADLEASLNARLLVRSTRRLSLTDTGVTYLAACKRILDDVHEADALASGDYAVPRGELTLTAPLVFGRMHVLPVVNAFLKELEAVSVRLELSDANVDLVAQNIDAAVRIGRLPDSSLIATRLGSIRRVVVGSPAYFEAHGLPKTPADLSEHPSVTFTTGARGDAWTFTGKSGPCVVRPPSRLSVNTAEAAIDAAVAGVGITRVLSYQVARAVRAKKLRVVLERFEPEPLPVHLLHAGRHLVPLKLRKFITFAAPRLREALTNADHRSASNFSATRRTPS